MFVLESKYEESQRKLETCQMELGLVRSLLRQADHKSYTQERLLNMAKRKIEELFNKTQEHNMNKITNKKVLDLIREKFKDRLQAKTGWGRNDVMVEYEQAVSDALAETLDQIENQTKETK